MRHEPNLRLDPYRKVHPVLGGSPSGASHGYFEIVTGLEVLRVVSSGQATPASKMRWEHVSVSLSSRCPTWDEMCRVKELFWQDDETVVQLHPPKSLHFNLHRFCLHLWRDSQQVQELPPREAL
jgi:hypothetical protein